MANYDYLRKQALKDVWRNPGIDRQFIIEPERITQIYGKRRYVSVVWETIKLPDQQSNWHVYDAGPVSFVTLNLFRNCEGWTPLSDATNKRGVYINAYIDSGLELPRFDSYYRYTNTGSLIFAFKINKRTLADLDNKKVFVRVYSGAAINLNQLPPPDPDKIKTKGMYVTDDASVLAFQDEIDALPTDGQVNIYHNGVWCDRLTKLPIKPADWIEYIYDSSFYKTFEFSVKDLFHYNSDMDSDQKYLLHYPGVSNEIDFYDDIDFYVYQKVGGEPFRGIYFHKNAVSAVRQLTHRDFGIRTRNFVPISRILSSIAAPQIEAPLDTLYIKMSVRRSNVVPNKLVFENTRLFELYKLKDEDILRAMQGIDSNVPFWSCPSLEKSFYSYAMGCTYNQLTKEVAEKMYGYNASAKIIGDTPIKIETNNIQDVELPIRMQHGCTIYEYDSEGLFINWYQHLAGKTYRPKNLETAYLEGIVGLGSDRLDQLDNVRQATLNEVYTYRVYNGSLISNSVQKTFEDVTGSDKYEIVNGVFKWLSSRSADYPILLSDAKFFAKDYRIRQQFGTLTITLTTQQKRPAGDGFYVMPFPLGQIDVILNKRSLIRNIDYFVNFPTIHIVNKEYLKDPLSEFQDIHIRFCGFPTKDFEITDEGDVGFIEHGFLSNNNKYDLRDDKVQRIVVDGKLYCKDELKFSEEHLGVSIIDAANGLPYMVKDVLVPVKPYTAQDMYELRDASRVIDKVVSDYLTLKLPQPERTPLMAIPKRYQVFSPFMNNLITDLRSGVLNIPTRIGGFSKQEVIDICKKYEYILDFDPIREPHLQDTRFINILPHGYPQVIGVSANSYRFLNKVVEIYCNGIIELSPFLKTI